MNASGSRSVPNPGIHNDYLVLNGVAALSASDAWAAGYDLNISYYGTEGEAIYNYAPLVERWNGASWNVVSSADPVPYSGQSGSTAILYGIAAGDSADVWDAGEYAVVGAVDSLIEREACQ